MNQPDNQSIVIEGVSEVLDGLLDDLSVQNAEVIKGGPVDHTIYVPFHVIRAK